MFGTLFKVSNFNFFQFSMKVTNKVLFQLSLIFVHNDAKIEVSNVVIFSGPAVVLLVRHGI